MIGNIFLIVIALVWLAVASGFDLKKREIPNWLSFSLLIFALAFRAFYSVVFSNILFFIYGLIGLLIFTGLAYGFYYSRVFAGGDAKLLIALGPILPFFDSLSLNLWFLGSFIFVLLLVGSVYGLIWSLVLVSGRKREFSREFVKQMKAKKSFFYIAVIFALISLGFLIYLREGIFILFPFLFLAFPFLYFYAKAVEEVCMMKKISASSITVGDWLYEKVRIGGKVIEPDWQGVSEEELKLLKKSKKKLLVKQGIPFVPVFLISFVLVVLFFEKLLVSLFNIL